jgi:hypothetical protein
MTSFCVDVVILHFTELILAKIFHIPIRQIAINKSNVSLLHVTTVAHTSEVCMGIMLT